MNTALLNDIHQMIQQDLATSRQLLSLLEQETESTQRRDYASLSNLLKQKTPLLEELKINAQKRSHWLSKMNCNADESHWAALLSTLKNGELQQWQEVRTTIEHCQNINAVNGKLISRGSQSHQRLLDVMRGGNNQAGLYDAHGSKHSARLSGHLTQA